MNFHASMYVCVDQEDRSCFFSGIRENLVLKYVDMPVWAISGYLTRNA